MKTFHKSDLPKEVIHNGLVFKLDMDLCPAGEKFSELKLKMIQANLKKENCKMVVVYVLSKNLKGKTDLHNKIYQPSQWIFVYRPGT